jgi:hypothetical protein
MGAVFTAFTKTIALSEQDFRRRIAHRIRRRLPWQVPALQVNPVSHFRYRVLFVTIANNAPR